MAEGNKNNRGIDIIANSRMVEKMIDDMDISEQWRDDLAQEVYLILCEYDEEKINDMVKNNQIRFFISRIITNQMFSSTSTFYRTFRQPSILMGNDIYVDDDEEDDF